MLYVLGNLFVMTIAVGWLIAAWRLGDWRNWRQYYATILFVVCIDFFVSIISYEHPLWYFHPSVITPNHTLADFFIALANFPPMLLTYLSRYPDKAPFLRQSTYVAAWALGNFIIEMIFFLTGMISYHNGWSSWWSAVFWFLAFLSVRLHSLEPLWAWLLILVLAIGGIWDFHIPMAHLK